MSVYAHSFRMCFPNELSKDNMNCIKHDIKKDFIMALKTNRLAALSLEDKIKGRFVRIDSLEKKSNTVKQVYLKGIAFPLTLTKQVFTNNDGSIGVLYLISNDINLTYDQITTIYQKRWKVEEIHKLIRFE